MGPVARAKFRCNSMTEQENMTVWDEDGKNYHQGTLYAYEFTPVTGNSPENSTFFGSTPGGKLTLTVVREKSFEVGKHYYLDFHEAAEA